MNEEQLYTLQILVGRVVFCVCVCERERERVGKKKRREGVPQCKELVGAEQEMLEDG